MVTIKDDLIGKKYKSKNSGEFTVLKYSHKKGYAKYYEIQFEDTKSKSIQARSNIVRGCVKDYWKPTIFGVAYRGDKTVVTEEENMLYDRWYAILSRIYNKKHSHYGSYGGKGVKICKSWHSFEQFYHDVKSLEGYDKDKLLKREIELDKDFKQENTPISKKVYSKNTCIWAKKVDNNRNQFSIQKEFIAISPDGKEYTSRSIRGFSREHNLVYDTVRYGLIKGTKRRNGWTFKYVNKED